MEGLEVVNELLGLSLMETTPASGPCEEYKGPRRGEEGCVTKFYLSATDCDRLSKAFSAMAAKLKEG